ncbi:NTP transferase domain-containing protein [Halomonas sp. DP8Y7-1]|uniref:nucleotidyltransferase family protein n=1 Tax=Halomonas sp. DP8Y7-1 TaxID=2859078 RepID=UPI001C979064|nr:NTP transferase domain-containing protein [Halomonas sp. DP8Y7-1]MBY6028448.1 NTP transferase domain-containing protein [Halomonas sp. DP8Y7-1]
MTTLWCVMAAAGSSRRFGRADKRLARLSDSRTLLAASLSASAALSARRLLVIGPHDTLAGLSVPASPGLEVLTLAQTSRSLGNSLAQAFNWLEHHASTAAAAAVWLADMAWVTPASCHRLAAQSRRDRLVRPTYQGQPGHPVIIGRDFWGEMGGLHGQEGARSVLARHPQARVDIAVDDPGVVRDLDRPQDPR